MPKARRILLTGGGSGGHIIPNLAIADMLKSYGGAMVEQWWSNGGSTTAPQSRRSRVGSTIAPQVDVLYVGSRNTLDRQLVEAAGIPFKAIFSGKLRRYFSWRNFLAPFSVLLGFFQSFFILIRFWPHAVFTKGGFVSLPVALAAWILRRPLILHESDRAMGLANRLTARLANKVCVGFPDLVTSEKFILTGNPVRRSILKGKAERGFQFTGLSPGKPVLLVWGGSQGAQEVNEMVESEFRKLKHEFHVVHITGKGKGILLSDSSYVAFDYLGEELADIYAITDFIVGRAGANSLYEIALIQKPNLLIPLKTAAHDHQTLNAEYFEQEGASIILRENDSLSDILIALLHNADKQEQMKENLKRIARPDAAQKIVDLILNF